jgi:hypothetical protein
MAAAGLGIFLALVVGCVVVPLLMRADSGGFSRIIDLLAPIFVPLKGNVMENILYAILAVPTAAYLFGLVAGCVHNRGCDTFKSEQVGKFFADRRTLALITVFILMSSLCLIYLVFIGCQLPYFFSAFSGQRPEGWLVYSEYARRGFFELCQITSINLLVLAAVNLLCKTPARESQALRILNSLMAILTMVLIATAFSKMTLYINVYGLSMRRLLPCIFMIYLGVVCVGIIALQKWRFSIMRLAAGVGVVVLCVLCFLNLEGFVSNYNAERYLAGRLPTMDVQILYLAGPAGVDAALRVYSQTDDPKLKTEIHNYISIVNEEAKQLAGSHNDNLQSAGAREKAEKFLVLEPIGPRGIGQ